MIKGIVLAAGRGTRLFPLTKSVPKVLLPVYDKPMIFYSIETLIGAGVKDIAIVTSIDGYNSIKTTIDGEFPEANISYIIDKKPEGNAASFGAAKKFFQGHDCILMFADNIILGETKSLIQEGFDHLKDNRSSIFVYRVENPRPFGVIESDKDGRVLSIEEKPEHPKSNLIAIGLYIFPKDVTEKLANLKLSPRGEYEITDVLAQYLDEDRLSCIELKNDMWFDTGNADDMLEASKKAREYKKK